MDVKAVKRSLAVLFCLCFLLIGCVDSNNESSDAAKTSTYFNYSGYSQEEYSSVSKQSQYVEMSDGVKLAVDIYLPTDGPAGDTFPVVFQYTPYGRSKVNPETGEIRDESENKLLKHGYALVVADMRGSGASYGMQLPFFPQLGEDGKALIDWIAEQSWSNGKVGMMGGSYVGWSQLVTAQHRPEALKCIVPEVILFEGYSEAFRIGGIAAQNWINQYSTILNAINLNYYVEGTIVAPATPMIDEDGDGDLVDEIPIMSEGFTMTFLDDGSPTYADGVERSNHYYYQVTAAHQSNPTFKSIVERMAYIDSLYGVEPYSDFTFEDGSPGSFVSGIAQSEIPIYHLGGWFDIFTRGSFKLYSTMASDNPSKLMVAPRFHQVLTDAYKSYFSYEGELSDQIFTEKLRFFDRYLKQIDNGIDTEDPIYLYVMHEGWRSESEWPLQRQVLTDFYLNSDNRLSTSASTSGSDVYEVDYTHSSAYGSNKASRWLAVDSPDTIMDRTEKDTQTLIYDSAVLESDLEVTGYPIIHLWVSSNQDYGDFFVYLTDVDETGRSVYVSEGELRAGWKDLQEDDEQVAGNIDVLPDLPWHGFKLDQWVDEPLADNTVIELQFDMVPTAWKFKKGHKIRVSIAGADVVDFELNPGLAPNNEVSEVPSTTINVHRTSAYPSRITLPVIP